MSANLRALQVKCQRLKASDLNEIQALVMVVLNNSSPLSPAIKNKYVVIYIVVTDPPLAQNASSPSVVNCLYIRV